VGRKKAAPPAPGAGASLGPTDGPLTFEELQLATRNRGLPLEALRYDVTPTGLHYLLVHFDIPWIDEEVWRLRVGGNVKRELALSLEELRRRPRRTATVTLECAGNGRARLQPRPLSQPWLHEAVSTAQWTGTPLAGLLEEAGLGPETVELVFTGADHGVEKGYEHDYGRSLTVAEAKRPEVLLAYEMNGRPLEPQHGFPLRLVVPGWYGMTQVKWLSRIEAVTEPFEGYQQRVAYLYRRDDTDPGEPVTRMRPRALLLPPGFPDFLTRRRTLDAGRVVVTGRAWSGYGEIVRVEFGVDGHWTDAQIRKAAGPYAWCGWSAEWAAEPGEHLLRCRATDAAGNRQPVEAAWNLQGMGNNLTQEVAVTVR
jgi:DMSO/TMAO reductase YedYZ molybdopterin-dependent catalytic subunit